MKKTEKYATKTTTAAEASSKSRKDEKRVKIKTIM